MQLLDQTIFPVVPRQYPGKLHQFILWRVTAGSGSNAVDSDLKAFQAIIDFPTNFQTFVIFHRRNTKRQQRPFCDLIGKSFRLSVC